MVLISKGLQKPILRSAEIPVDRSRPNLKRKVPVTVLKNAPQLFQREQLRDRPLHPSDLY